MTTPLRLRRRALEGELRDLPVPPPPADLLAKIQAGIPAHLDGAEPQAAAARAGGAGRSSGPWLRLAAALAVVAVGLTLATRVVREKDSRSEFAMAQVERPKQDEKHSLKGKHESLSGVAVETAAAPSTSFPGTVPAPKPPPEPDPRSAIDEAVAPIEARSLRPVVKEAGAVADATGVVHDADLHAASAHAEPSRARIAQPETPAGTASRQSPPSLQASAAPSLDARSQGATGGIAVPERESQAASEPALRSLGYVGGVEAEAGGRVRKRGDLAAPPVDAMYFRDAGTHPFVDSAEDRLSTFALDVDTGSWTLTREYLGRGLLPPAAAVRVEEFVNAQRYDDPAPRRGEFTLIAEGAPSPFLAGAAAADLRLLRFAVKARELAARERRPANLTFVVDVSGSMDRENRLGLVKRSLALLLDGLREDDRVALVVYGTRGRVLLRPTRDHEAIREAIHALRPEGSTNAEEGLRMGYDLAGEMFRAGASNRVILCSDGVANVGATGPESILARIGSEARRGIELTTVGFGMGNYNDALMEQLADQGDGRYHYVDSLDEARRIFVDDLAGTLETVAKDAKIQVEFDPATVKSWRLLGYENRDVADRDFRNDRVDAGEVGAGHAATALYEIRLAPRARPRDTVATLRLRWKSVATGAVDEAALTLRVSDLDESFRSASPNLRRAGLAAELAERLKGARESWRTSWSTLVAEAHHLALVRRGDANLGDLVATIERAANLAGERHDDLRGPREPD